MREGMSKTAFLVLASIIGFGIFGTFVLALVTGKPVGILTIGGFIFGLLTVGLFILLSENKYQLNDDFKMTFIRVKKYTLPEGVDQDEVFVDDDDEVFVDGEDDIRLES